MTKQRLERPGQHRNPRRSPVRSTRNSDKANRHKPLDQTGPTVQQLDEARKILAKANAYRSAGKLEQAGRVCEELLRLYPDYVGALHMLGLICMATDKYWQALNCLIRATMLHPLDWSILTSLGQVYMGLDAPRQAVQVLNISSQLNPQSHDTFYLLGESYYQEKQYEKSIVAFENAVALKPSDAAYFQRLGRAYQQVGKIEDARSAFASAVRSQPNHVPTLISLASLSTSSPADQLNLETQLQEEIRQRDVSGSLAEDPSPLFALANHYHFSGQHDCAWAMLERANGLVASRDSFDFASYRTSKQQALEIAESTVIARQRASDPINGLRPVFILGASRSGKTTLEKLLGSLPAFARGFENNYVELAARYASQSAGLLSINKLTQLPPDLNDTFAKYYRSVISEDTQPKKEVFLTTTPGLIYSVGRISESLKESLFIFVSRDSFDTAFKMYSKLYRKNENQYSYNMKSAVYEVVWYKKMSLAWSNCLPHRCMQVEYSDLASDPKVTLDAVAEFCGVEALVPDDLTAFDDRGCSLPYRDRLDAALDDCGDPVA